MAGLTRRAFVQGTTALVATLAGGALGIARAEDRPALPIPAELRPDASGAIRLNVRTGSLNLVPAGPTPTLGINGNYLGPAMRFMRGDKVAITVANTLDQDTTMHWHGLELPGEEDGGPHNIIAPGGEWTARFTIDQPAATCWNHPHFYPSTAEQVIQGIAGLFIIGDEESDGLALPSTWGVDDIPIVLQDRRFNADGSFFHRFNMVAITTGYIGDVMLVNGARYPVAKTARGWLRLRLLNGSNARSYRIAAKDGRKLYVIGNDGGLLAEPAPVDVLPIAPGERYEVLVDARDGKAFDLVTLPVGYQIGMTLPPFHEPLALLTLSPEGADGKGTLPDTLVTLPPLIADLPAASQDFELDMLMDEKGMALLHQAGLGMPGMGDMGHQGHQGQQDHQDHQGAPMNMPMAPDPAVVEKMTELIVNGPALPLAEQLAANAINGKPFAMGEKGIEVPLKTDLRWAVSEGTDHMFHPFHVHGTQFRILSNGGTPPPAYMAGWKDTVSIRMGARAEFQVRFNHPAPQAHPYMAHCHILEHEDSGMMTQFSVA